MGVQAGLGVCTPEDLKPVSMDEMGNGVARGDPRNKGIHSPCFQFGGGGWLELSWADQRREHLVRR